MGDGLGSIAGAGASIFGSMASSSAAKKAASAQLQSTAMQIQAAQAAQAEQRAYLGPYMQVGNNALTDLDNLKSYFSESKNYDPVAVPNAPTQTFSVPRMTQAELQATPGYEFNLNQGLRGAQNSLAAKGLGLSGAGVKASTRYASGLADSTYQNQFNNLLQKANLDFGQQQSIYGNQMQAFSADVGQKQQLFNNDVTNKTNYYNRLLALANMGQASSAGVGAGALQTGANIGNAWASAGNAMAASQLAQGRATSSGITNAGAYLSQGLRGSGGMSNPFAGLFGGSGSGGYGFGNSSNGFDFNDAQDSATWS